MEECFDWVTSGLTSHNASSNHRTTVASAMAAHTMYSTETAAPAATSGRNSDPVRPTGWTDRVEGCHCSRGQTKYPISTGTTFAGQHGTWHTRSPLSTLRLIPIFATACSFFLASISLWIARVHVWINFQNFAEAAPYQLSRIPVSIPSTCRLRICNEINHPKRDSTRSLAYPIVT